MSKANLTKLLRCIERLQIEEKMQAPSIVKMLELKLIINYCKELLVELV